ncbi:MAG: GNAT family N-acetyltransferase [Acidimicrobiia bacterium]
MSTAQVRVAVPTDAPRLQQIELLAGEQFRQTAYAAVADHDPLSLDQLAAYERAGRSWVAVDVDDEPIGYIVVDVVDGDAHVEQVSVLPHGQGQGLGRALMDVVEGWARDTGRSAITLTTFVDVPWNAPLYRHLGFSVLADSEIGPELRSLVAEEAAHGLDPATRVCMRKPLDR